MHSHYDTALNNALTLMTWLLTMHSHHEHHQWSHHLQTSAWEVHCETSTTFQRSFVLQNTSLRLGPSNSSVRGGVTDTSESVTHWVLTCRPPCALWCHSHMWVSYTLDFNILSTLHSVVSHSQPHVSQLLDFNMLSTLCPVVSSHMQVSYTLDFNMMSTLHSVVSQPHVSQLVSYTSDFNMMSTLYSVVSQPHVLQTGF